MIVNINVSIALDLTNLYTNLFLDINECTSTLGLNNCQQKCFNNIGSYKCGCNKGYQLTSDQKTCKGINK